MKKRFWMSYDLGIDGDYDGIYEFLDTVAAVECGDSTCSFEIEIGKKDAPSALLSQIKRHAKLRAKDRLYAVWRRADGGVTGKFIAGTRHRAPWVGYAVSKSGETEDAED